MLIHVDCVILQLVFEKSYVTRPSWRLTESSLTPRPLHSQLHLKPLLQGEYVNHFYPLQPSGAFILPILNFLLSHLQVTWIILSYSAHLYLYLVCQTIGGKFPLWLILAHLSRNILWVTFMPSPPYMTHGLRKYLSHINGPVFQIWNLTKPNLSHRILCGPKRVNPGTL